MKTKLLNILAALALTAASSLAIHQSASAYGAYHIAEANQGDFSKLPRFPLNCNAGDGPDDANFCPAREHAVIIGVSVDEEQSAALTRADQICDDKVSASAFEISDLATNCSADTESNNAFSTVFMNQCFAFAADSASITDSFRSPGTGMTAGDARMDAVSKCQTGRNVNPFSCDLVDLNPTHETDRSAFHLRNHPTETDGSNNFVTAVCDHTCDINDANADMRFDADANTAGCRAANKNSECEMVDSTMPYFDSTIGDSGGCRAALECGTPTDGSGRSDTGGCEDCTENQEEFNNQCMELCLFEQERRGDDPTCVCPIGEERVDGEGDCVAECPVGTMRAADMSCEDIPLPTCDAAANEIINMETRMCDCVDTHERNDENVCTEIVVDTFDPDSCGMDEYANDTECTGSCETLNREGEAGASCGACLTNFMHATDTAGGTTACTEIVPDTPTCDADTETLNSDGDACICASTHEQINGEGDCVAKCVAPQVRTESGCATPATPTTNNNPPAERGISSKLAAGIGASVAAFMVYYFVNYELQKAGILTWTPTYAFHHNNGNLSYSLGSRWTANTDNWRFYWQTANNGNGNTDKFRYGSGIKYNNGIFFAAMDSESDSDKTAVDLSFAANQTIGLWNLGGGYNFDMQLSDDKTESQNHLNAKVRYTMDKWILSANANTNGNTGTARINYSYRF